MNSDQLPQSDSTVNETKPTELTSWQIFVFYSTVIGIFGFCVVGLLVYASVQQAIESSSRTNSRINLTDIGQAIHMYEQGHLSFPESASKDDQGRPLLSWRVHLLPYLGFQELHYQFDLTQPWNSEQNQKLISQMPEIFQCPEMDSGEFKTNCLLVVGIETVFPPQGTTKLGDITDGTSNTIMAVEANTDQAVIWTKPGDLNHDPENPSKGTGELRPGLTLILMVDGTVQIFGNTINEKVLKALFTKAGQEKMTFGESFGI